MKDALINIATGKHRKEISWRNRQITWGTLTEKLSKTHYTAETVAEYSAANKPRQDEIKDIGGFVGGYLSRGRRKAGNVLHRSILTLDADFATKDFWLDFTVVYGCAACYYSTHKHTPAAPRYRLLILLNRTVRPDEYEALGRLIAGSIDIEVFDPTTFQPERLMYWPSTSKDGEFESGSQDGEPLDVDAMLAKYHDWQDTSEWPVSAKVDKILQRGMTKQGDPLEKPGIIGAFCRTYNIHEVIETFLNDVYEPTETENRYSYRAGSTAGGLVVYDDKFTYSHHGTDPTSGHLCNAFDLVRMHKFGLHDEKCHDDTPTFKRPSHELMEAFCAKDEKVKKAIGAERLQDAAADFEGIEIADDDTPGVEENTDWITQLEVDKKGNYYNTISNVSIILENDPYLKGRFAFDAFARKKLVVKNTPWRKITPETKYLKDEDELNLYKYLERVYGITSKGNIKDAFDIHIDACSFHPVRDYLNGLSWDGVKRVDTLFIDYLGAEDSEYVRAVSRKALVACIARIYNPGVKFDYMLTTIGVEGVYKSTLLRKLGGRWFSDSFSFNMLSQGNKAYEQTIGSWIIEVAELSGLKNSEVEAVKHFLSKQDDSFRPAYGRNTLTVLRQWVAFGTSNNDEFLISRTGNRRFWPVRIRVQEPVKNVVEDLTEYEVGQVWAEAIALYKKGEPLYLDNGLEMVAKSVQREHTETDARAGIVQKYLETLLPENWEELSVYERRNFIRGDELQAPGTVQRMRVCAAEIWFEALGGTEKDFTRIVAKDMNNIMREMEGWSSAEGTLKFGRYGAQRGFLRVTLGVTKSGNVTKFDKRKVTLN